MAARVLTNAFLSIAGTDVSDEVTDVTLTYSADVLDADRMGETAHERIGGLKDWSVSATLQQNYGNGSVDALLFSRVGSSVAVIVRADQGSASAANPQFAGNAIIESYDPVAGAVGDRQTTPITLQGNGALSRST